ncbi:response regulator transcription factor [Silvimonas sp.]|uniref:response regulator transcription factor n=1 Tax=Silvimonas sp. TaxID=2650811 RepID=UPI00284E3B36|nr:response regulator transcription factor [Silvimonas sp.]MDR3428771.1 response regulator transcription factor [Silvimonas sp.]
MSERERAAMSGKRQTSRAAGISTSPVHVTPACSAEQTKIRILVADDHCVVREGLSSMISRQPDMVVIGVAANGRDAVKLWREDKPDVCLLDLRMPLLDGVGAIEEIRRHDATARAIMLTTFDTDADISSAIKAGARGYLLKDVQREELLECIRKVHAGAICIPATVVAKLAIGMSSEALTARELDVLVLLASGKSNKEIGVNLYVSETTVKSHLRRIFTKLNVLSRTEAIAVASRRGLVQI